MNTYFFLNIDKKIIKIFKKLINFFNKIAKMKEGYACR